MSTQTPIGLDTVVSRSDEPVAVEVDRSVVMMSVDQGMYFGLEGTAPRIWALLERPRSVRDLCEQLAGEYEVDAELVRREVCTFLEELRQAHLIRIHDQATGTVLPPSGS